MPIDQTPFTEISRKIQSKIHDVTADYPDKEFKKFEDFYKLSAKHQEQLLRTCFNEILDTFSESTESIVFVLSSDQADLLFNNSLIQTILKDLVRSHFAPSTESESSNRHIDFSAIKNIILMNHQDPRFLQQLTVMTSQLESGEIGDDDLVYLASSPVRCDRDDIISTIASEEFYQAWSKASEESPQNLKQFFTAYVQRLKQPPVDLITLFVKEDPSFDRKAEAFMEQFVSSDETDNKDLIYLKSDSVNYDAEQMRDLILSDNFFQAWKSASITDRDNLTKFCADYIRQQQKQRMVF